MPETLQQATRRAFGAGVSALRTLRSLSEPARVKWMDEHPLDVLRLLHAEAKRNKKQRGKA